MKDGLGIEEVSLDFGALHGIVALIGRNGAGKSTTLEMMQPFRELPSRKISLKDAFFLRDSYRDVTFEFNGKLYRSLVTVDAQSGKSDGFLWENGEPLSKEGKVSQHDEKLIEILGSPEFFFKSVFSPAEAESLLSLRPAARKDFFVEFLDRKSVV